MNAAIATLTIVLGASLLHAAEYHVSLDGVRGNPGTAAKPFGTISAAAEVAQPGDVITVHAGIYRERVNPRRGGLSDDRRITYRAVPGEKVVITGAEVVKGWKKMTNGTWEVSLPASFFGDFNPFGDVIGGEWYGTPKGGFDHHTGAVYLNGQWIFSTIEGNTISDIAVRGWIGGPDVAGLKLLASHDVIIRNNHIYRCAGVGGIWLDWMAQGVRVTGNLLHDNSTDLFMEVNHGPFLIDHNLFLSARSLRDWSQGGAYAHNLVAGTVVGRKETRKTPFFSPHGVRDMKIADIQHKDLRFHNNLFVGAGGLAGFDQMAEKLQTAGNVHVGAARPGVHERDALADPQFTAGPKLEERPDGWWLEMSVDPAWSSEKTRAIVTSELLGRARIPDAPFEQPDGSPYRLDADCFGRKRSGDHTAPGAFELAGERTIRLKVWPKRTWSASGEENDE